jgi:Kef-type K+ transport system membrane component KefB
MSGPAHDERPLLGGKSALATLAAYSVMLLVAVGLYLGLVRRAGESLVAPAAEGELAVVATNAHAGLLWHVLLALAVIVVCARALGAFFERVLQQPPVMGEIVAGLLLGPSALGAISPAAASFLLPTDVAPYLGIVAKIGVVLFMFLVGLELDARLLRGSSHATMAVSHASIVAPFFFGTALALALYPRYSNDAVSFTVFSLFVGVSMSVTAFPVLARILSDRGIQHTPLGATAIACAAVDDVTAWCLLALVSGVASAQLDGTLVHARSVGVYLAVMLLVVRARSSRSSRRTRRRRPAPSRSTCSRWSSRLCCSRPSRPSRSASTPSSARSSSARSCRTRAASRPRSAPPRGRRRRDVPAPSSSRSRACARRSVSSRDAGDWLMRRDRRRRDARAKFGGTLVAARFSGLGWRESGARHPHEHARPDGAHRAQRRPRHARALADALRDDGAHGPRHDLRDEPDLRVDHARPPEPRAPHLEPRRGHVTLTTLRVAPSGQP